MRVLSSPPSINLPLKPPTGRHPPSSTAKHPNLHNYPHHSYQTPLSTPLTIPLQRKAQGLPYQSERVMDLIGMLLYEFWFLGRDLGDRSLLVRSNGRARILGLALGLLILWGFHMRDKWRVRDTIFNTEFFSNFWNLADRVIFIASYISRYQIQS